ncbi:DNA polymerase III subunit gamma/tau [Mycoplasma sp. 2634B]|uniref:DNA polymerase III subunit gamma/tau n=1 Tax=unclassified Mycoplasma TaxID=2683645 RepID=UPI003AAFD8C0
MSYKTLYRKYRPNTFEQVVGQEHIVKTLQNIILSGKVGHAYLFCGPKGTGKTSVAKIFANVLNCSHNNNSAISCQNCLSHFNDSLDIIEMDAASNNGVDEIRDLKEKIEQAPINSKYKIYIIDEVHMLTKSAFNALLKTLEEPPVHSIFILATTDVQKVPLTIRSRVQAFNFNRMSDKDIIQHLAHVLDLEGAQYEPEALRIIARLSSGGMRDALSIADQAASFNGGNITADSLYANFGILSTSETIGLMNLILNANAYELIKKLNELEQKGIDPSQLVLSLLNLNKEKLLYLKTKSSDLLAIYTTAELEQVATSIHNCFILADTFYDMFVKVQRSPFPFEIIELGLLKALQEFETAVAPSATVQVEIKKQVEPEPKVQIKEEIILPSEETEVEPEVFINLTPEIEEEPQIQKPSEQELNIQHHTTESVLNLVSENFKFDIGPSVDIDLVSSNLDDNLIESNASDELQNVVDQKVHDFLNAPVQDSFLANKLIKEDDDTYNQIDLSFSNAIEQNNKTQAMVNEMLSKTQEFLLNNNDQEGDIKDVDSEIINDQINTGEKENLISTREIDINKIQDFTSLEYNKETPIAKKIPYEEFLKKRGIEEYVNDARWIQMNAEHNLTSIFKSALSNIDSVLLSKPEFKEQVALFKQLVIMFGSDRFIVVTSNDQAALDQVAKKGDSQWLQSFIAYLFGEPYKYIYPISHARVQEIKQYISSHNKDDLPPIVEPEFLEEIVAENNDDWFINRANLFR